MAQVALKLPGDFRRNFVVDFAGASSDVVACDCTTTEASFTVQPHEAPCT